MREASFFGPAFEGDGGGDSLLVRPLRFAPGDYVVCHAYYADLYVKGPPPYDHGDVLVHADEWTPQSHPPTASQPAP